MDNHQPMKASCSDYPLTLQILAVGNLHKQYSPIATSKIFICLPQSQIILSKKFLPLNTNSTHSHTHFQQVAEDLKENLSIPGDTLYLFYLNSFSTSIFTIVRNLNRQNKRTYLHPHLCTHTLANKTLSFPGSTSETTTLGLLFFPHDF